MPDETTPATPSPTGSAVLPQNLIRYAVALVTLAAAVQVLPDCGIVLPAIVLSIDKAVLAIGVILGITSQGVRRPTDK